ncbi:MAG: hypothetical protein WA432_04535 [Candidatus Babeliaceae bacterium]
MKLSKKILFGLCFFTLSSAQEVHIGLCIMATGNYIEYAWDLIQSARRYFCKEQKVTYFVFTDGTCPDTASDVVVTYQGRLGWPYDTLKRFHVYYENRALLDNCDYVFAIDADMLFMQKIRAHEILGDLVATQHPGFIGRWGDYEKNQKSSAYVKKNNDMPYFCGGFYGGRLKEFLRLISCLKNMIDQDLFYGYIAKWHDESYLNRYLVEHNPTLILSASYCFPESPQPRYYPAQLWQLSHKIIARDKNHTRIRA